MSELSRRRRLLILAICCMSLFIVGLDNTIVNLALPSIKRELGSSLSSLQWTIDAYTIVLASLLMLSGSVADRVGRKRTFQIGLVLFGIGSLLCGIAPNTGLLIAFRALQAIGGSMLNPVAMSIITNTFTDPRERANAIGVWGGVIGLSMALGPVLGGVLVDAVSWRSVFWINVPIAALAVLLVALFVPESRAQHARRLDPVGQVSVMLVLLGLTFGIIEGPHTGWTSPLILGCFAVALAALVFLIGYERRIAEPLLNPRFFRSIPFSGATLIAICAFAALSGFLFLNMMYLQSVRGFSALHAGLLTIPMAAANAIFAPLSGRIVGSVGPRIPLLIAGASILGGGIMLTGIGTQTSLLYLGVAYLLFGIGFGMVNAPITNAAVSGMPRAQAGTAAAVASTSRQVGASLGVAVLGSVVTSNITGPFGSGFVDASRLTWWIMAAIGVAIVVLALLTTGRRAVASAAAVVPQEPSEVRSA
ncbi:MFS transporter [Sciscionella sediminilitoris]|uniref:MFS transporter n=1 Tax=Sciscionella sediminilitoris TaxID=1445613 RepID=UPI0004DFA000|nr:MFS transporter [Sciscionella sp. SE31]